MGDLPSGTITFLFSDIEGSTRVVQRLGPGYDQVLALHHRLLQEAIEKEGGLVVSTHGDSIFSVFISAPGAVRAALAGQKLLADQSWPTGGAIRVRMGIHTGEGQVSGDTYIGIDVHRAARIADAGHGGQVLASATTKALSESELQPRVWFRDIGAYRLKDLPDPERLYQVDTPDSPSGFPPIRSLESRPHNLPAYLTEFVGRTREMAAVAEALAQSRLVTLLGPGGMGKTRLAIAVAADLLPRFADGVVFVDLAELHDPDQVTTATAAAVGLTDTDGDVTLALAAHLMPRQCLLVLDNFEQVIMAGPWLAEMVRASPELKVLVTSRIRMRITGEHVYEIPPLGLPGGSEGDGLGAESVELFVRRARAVDNDFAMSTDNGVAVAAIVHRLEGLPLAIELAAARVRLLPPPLLAARLEHGLSALGSGPSDLPPRHRTMKDAIGWSHALLDPDARTLLTRLGVFAGGFTLAAAEAVGAGPPVDDLLEALAGLLDASLIRRRVEEGMVRFALLEPVREFALDRLHDSGEEPDLKRRHATYFLDLAEAAEPNLSRSDQTVWLNQMSADHDNLRAALGFSLAQGEPDLGLRLGGALWRFWHASGQMSEGRRWLEQLLVHPSSRPTSRAKGLSGLAGLAYWQGDYTTTQRSYEEALEIYRGLGDRLGEAHTLFGLSTTLIWSGDVAEGARLIDQARDLYEKLGERGEVRNILMAKGFVRWRQGDLAGARPLWEESMEIARNLGDDAEAATNQLALASLTFLEGDGSGALALAGSALEELLALKNHAGVVMALDWIAALAASEQPYDASRLAGAAQRLRARQGGGIRPDSVGVEAAQDAAARLIGKPLAAAGFEEGAALELETAVSLARTMVENARVATDVN